MSEMNHNVIKVNTIVDSIKQEATKYDSAMSEIDALTNKIISAHGFGLVGGLSAGQYSAQLAECKAECEFLTNTIRSVQLQLIKYSQSEEDLNKFLGSVTSDEWKVMGYTPEMIPKDLETLNSNGSDIAERAVSELTGEHNLGLGDTVLGWLGTGAAAIAEGVGQFVEAGVDLLDIAIVGGGGALVTLLTTGSTAQAGIWFEQTKARTSNDWVSAKFDEHIYSADFIMP